MILIFFFAERAWEKCLFFSGSDYLLIMISGNHHFRCGFLLGFFWVSVGFLLFFSPWCWVYFEIIIN